MDPDINDLNNVLSTYIRALDNRSNPFIVYNESLLNNLSKWHLLAWKKWIANLGSENANTTWFLLYEQIDQGLRKVGTRSINAKQYAFTCYFMQNYCSFMERHKTDEVITAAKTCLYVSYSYNLFFNLIADFLATAESERDYFWENFPKNWKITETNLVENKIFAKLAFHEFLEWAQARIHGQKNDYDLTFHYMIKGLFPEVNLSMWETIMLFIFFPYSSTAKVRSVVERFWPIGKFSIEDFVVFYSVKPGEDERSIREQEDQRIKEKLQISEKKTFQLAKMLFSDKFSKSNLQNYIAEAEKLRYDLESDTEEQRLQILKILNGIAGI